MVISPLAQARANMVCSSWVWVWVWVYELEDGFGGFLSPIFTFSTFVLRVGMSLGAYGSSGSRLPRNEHVESTQQKLFHSTKALGQLVRRG